MAILGIDWLLFAENAASLGLATPLTIGLGLTLGGLSTLWLQRRAGDSWAASLGKGLCAGVLIGVPFPIFGSIVGAAVAAQSGVQWLRSGRRG